ncbi:hypothetical protein LC593_03515 [Nostoc sp. CHAB 5844]|nr:hypothetical protein [Nostoc sp. CHAB 5844]
MTVGKADDSCLKSSQPLAGVLPVVRTGVGNHARQLRDCRQSRRQSPQVEPVRCGGSKRCSNWRGRAAHGAVSPTHCRRSCVEDRCANTTAPSPQRSGSSALCYIYAVPIPNPRQE